MGMDNVGFKKIFYKIGEVGKLTGLKEHVIRFWESEFSPLRPKKNKGGQRLFIHDDIRLLFDIKKMLYEEGYTIAGAKRALRNGKLQDSVVNEQKQGLEEIVKSVKQELEELLRII